MQQTETERLITLEGEGNDLPYYTFFVCGEKKGEFISFLSSYNIQKDIVKVRRNKSGDFFCFELDIKNRADYKDLELLLGETNTIAYYLR